MLFYRNHRKAKPQHQNAHWWPMKTEPARHPPRGQQIKDGDRRNRCAGWETEPNTSHWAKTKEPRRLRGRDAYLCLKARWTVSVRNDVVMWRGGAHSESDCRRAVRRFDRPPKLPRRPPYNFFFNFLMWSRWNMKKL